MSSRYKIERIILKLLIFGWGIYVLAIFTIGQNPSLTRMIIWRGGLIIGLPSIFFVIRFPKLILRRETLYLLGFLVWVSIGFIKVKNQYFFAIYVKMIIEFLLLIIIFSTLIELSGEWNIIWLAFWLIGIYNFIYISTGNFAGITNLIYSQTRFSGAIGNPNGLSMFGLWGVIGGLFLLSESKKLFMKITFFIGMVIGFLDIILGGSRGAYMFFILFFSLTFWSFSKRKNLPYKLLILIILAVSVYFLQSWITHNTFIGRRLSEAVNMSDRSSQLRFSLVKLAIELFIKNPFMGIGLGQFAGIYALEFYGGAYYSHNELAELLSTTGIVGTYLIFKFYHQIWKNFQFSLRTFRRSNPYYKRVLLAKNLLISLVFASLTFRPNIIVIDTILILSMLVGISEWSKKIPNLVNVKKNVLD